MKFSETEENILTLIEDGYSISSEEKIKAEMLKLYPEVGEAKINDLYAIIKTKFIFKAQKGNDTWRKAGMRKMNSNIKSKTARNANTRAGNKGKGLTVKKNIKKEHILELIKQGKTKGEIQNILGVVPATVNWHIKKLIEAGLLYKDDENQYVVKSTTNDLKENNILDDKVVSEAYTKDLESEKLILEDTVSKATISDFKGGENEDEEIISENEMDEPKTEKSLKKNARKVDITEKMSKELIEKTPITSMPPGTEIEVIHPNHYNTEHFECWTVWKEIVKTYHIPAVEAALLLNVFKYIWRYNSKGTAVKDLEKASNYLNELIEEVKNGD